MRTSKFFALGVIFSALFFFQSLGAEVSEEQVNSPDNPNYVVIGAFSVFKNAISFTSQASKLSLSAKYEMNLNRNLYYVYVLSTNDRQQAIEEALRLRKESPYSDTWVFNGLLGQMGSAVRGTDINPLSEQSIDEVKAIDSAPLVSTSQSTPSPADTVAEVKAETKEVIIPEKPVNEVVSKDKLDSKDFVFKIFRSDNKEQVEGDVNVIDADRTRKMGRYTGNKQISLSNPKSKEGKISLLCEVFGYRKIQRDLDYETPEGDDIQIDENNATVVPFELVRLQKGDIAVMYNVQFFNDAAVMRPEARYEITSLLEMLKENTLYKIRIHGHTNSGQSGKIISLKPGNENYFALNDTKEGSGSAKALSQERAEVVRNFLVSNGVDGKRMQVTAWGGKRPLYDKHSPQAQSNVRVEIEILEHK